jgi:hypothetical protein
MKKRSTIIIIAVLVFLATAIGVLVQLNKSDVQVQQGSVAITKDSQVLAELTMDDITAMDYIEVEKEIVSSNHANDEGLFRGVPVHQILEQTVQDFASEATQVVIYAQDGYVTAFSMDEITESDNIFLAYSKNGQGLGTLDDGGTGPFRIIIQEDEFGTRSVKYVNQIQLR